MRSPTRSMFHNYYSPDSNFFWGFYNIAQMLHNYSPDSKLFLVHVYMHALCCRQVCKLTGDERVTKLSAQQRTAILTKCKSSPLNKMAKIHQVSPADRDRG